MARQNVFVRTSRKTSIIGDQRPDIDTEPKIEGRLKPTHPYSSYKKANILFLRDRWLPIPPEYEKEVLADSEIETRPIGGQ